MTWLTSFAMVIFLKGSKLGSWLDRYGENQSGILLRTKNRKFNRSKLLDYNLKKLYTVNISHYLKNFRQQIER